MAAHGGEDEWTRALILEPVAELPGQNINAGNAAAAYRYGDALFAEGTRRQCQSVQSARYFLRQVSEGGSAGGHSFQDSQSTEGMMLVGRHGENSRYRAGEKASRGCITLVKAK